MSNKLFQELELHNKPHRNGYNLSHRVNFTAKAGELLPIAHFDCIIGDKFRIDFSHFSRTAPADTAAATKIREYVDFFFIPYRLLWKNAPAVHTQNTQNPVSATSPKTNLPVGTTTPQFDFTTYFPTSNSTASTVTILHLLGQKENMFGYNRGYMSAKLMNHLGYNYFSNKDIETAVGTSGEAIPYYGQQYLSLYPLLAYQCVYYNFFRNSQWENNQPYNYNVDYLSQSTVVNFPTASSDPTWQAFWDNPTLFDLQYANYPKDLFFGFFPDAQYGDEATVTVDVNNGAGESLAPVGSVVSGQLTQAYASPTTIQQTSGTVSISGLRTAAGTASVGALMADVTKDFEASFGILELRKAQFLQKYKEIRGSGNQTYANLVRKIFGVNIPDTLDTVPLYLGGCSSTISFSEVENTNLEGDNEPTIKGKGTGGSEMRTINFEPKENGCIMAIYHCQPVVDYALTNLHFDVVRTEADDFANPIFDQLGFQEIPSYFFSTKTFVNSSGGNPFTPTTLGYTTRYFDYKTAVDRTLGDFRETSKTWLAPLNFDYLQNYVTGNSLDINANFFKVNPAILDPIFALKASSEAPEGSKVTTDQVRVFSNFNISAIRPLDKDGTPY